jgi:hypothetical protein
MIGGSATATVPTIVAAKRGNRRQSKASRRLRAKSGTIAPQLIDKPRLHKYLPIRRRVLNVEEWPPLSRPTAFLLFSASPLTNGVRRSIRHRDTGMFAGSSAGAQQLQLFAVLPAA